MLRLGMAILLAVAFTGCSGTASNSNVSIQTGTAYGGLDQVGIKGDDGWFYSVPSDVMWTDAKGSVVEGARSACLPMTGQSARVKFAATQVTVHGTTVRPVVWVFCEDASAST